MEYDDRYHPSADNDYDNKNSRELSEIKKLDRGYNEIFRMIPDNKGVIKRKKIVVYNSGPFDSRIRNAQTGMYYSDVVGTSGEDNYFSVIMARGDSPKGPLTMFYDSPEQYERHQHCIVSSEIKSKWLAKREAHIL